MQDLILGETLKIFLDSDLNPGPYTPGVSKYRSWVYLYIILHITRQAGDVDEKKPLQQSLDQIVILQLKASLSENSRRWKESPQNGDVETAGLEAAQAAPEPVAARCPHGAVRSQVGLISSCWAPH